MRQSSGLRLIQAYQLGWRGLAFNMGNKNGVGNLPYTNVGTPLATSAKLRQAFEEAIDRNELNKVVFEGLFQPACTLIAPANTAWYEATKVPCTPYDPKDAKKLVAASGFPSPTVHLLTANTTRPLPAYVLWCLTRFGKLCTHGPHQVAQKSTSTTFPFCSAIAASTWATVAGTGS